MSEYIIVERQTARDLEQVVNTFINKGYTPVGGISYGNGMFYQAMVKR